MKITGAIFDMDGTLLNSMDYWAVAPCEYLKSLGITPDDDTSRLFLEDGMKNWFDTESKKYNLTVSYSQAKDGIYSFMNKKYDTDVILKEGAYEMLEKLQANGVKMCLATATDREAVEKILKRLKIDKFFSRIFTSGEVGVGKRQPLIYRLALEHLGTSKETTYVFEDAIYAMRTAFDDGFMVAGVYDKNVFATEDEVREKCHIYLDKDSKYKFDIDTDQI